MDSVISVDHSNCTGCKTCEMICSLYHFGQCNPLKSAIRVIRRERGGLIFCLPLVCQQCDPAPCIESCPTGALSRDDTEGRIILDQEACTVCGLCTEACPLGCMVIGTDDKALVGCDLCGGDPQCIPACHAACLKAVKRSMHNEKKEIERLTGIIEQENLIDHIPGRRSSS